VGQVDSAEDWPTVPPTTGTTRSRARPSAAGTAAPHHAHGILSRIAPTTASGFAAALWICHSIVVQASRLQIQIKPRLTALPRIVGACNSNNGPITSADASGSGQLSRRAVGIWW